MKIIAKWLLYGIPILFIIGAFMHFAFEFTGENIYVGMIAPVNESVWEHAKMIVVPMMIWWIGFELLFGRKLNINREKWYFGLCIALVVSIVFMISFYYTYTQAFGVELLSIDILDLFLSIAVGQLLGLHYYKYGKGVNLYFSLLIICIFLIFVVFTFYPPKLPVFQDSTNGTYGIQKS